MVLIRAALIWAASRLIGAASVIVRKGARNIRSRMQRKTCNVSCISATRSAAVPLLALSWYVPPNASQVIRGAVITRDPINELPVVSGSLKKKIHHGCVSFGISTSRTI